MKCKYCGGEIDFKTMKCSACGTRINLTDGGQSFYDESDLAVWEVEDKSYSMPMTAARDVSSPQIQAAANFAVTGKYKAAKKNKKKSISSGAFIAICATGAVLLVALGWAIFSLFSGSGTGEFGNDGSGVALDLDAKPCCYCDDENHTGNEHPKCEKCDSIAHKTEEHTETRVKEEKDAQKNIAQGKTVSAIVCDTCGGGHPTTAHPTCPKCGSTEHTIHVEDECAVEGCKGKERHTTREHADACPFCGSTEHKEHPKCSVCGSMEHTEHPTCPVCGRTEHLEHPKCGICESQKHKTEDHPCPKCDGKGHSESSCTKKDEQQDSGNKDTQKCATCGSTKHTTAKHPKQQTKCATCGSTQHTTAKHPKQKTDATNSSQSAAPSQSTPAKCSVCGSTSHTTHPKCSVCGSTAHTTHPKPKCPTCGSTAHTTHPKCSVCGSTAHATHPQQSQSAAPSQSTPAKCSVCGSTAHTTHPTCSVCGSTSHTQHPSCPTCGSTDHTSHPKCPVCGSTAHTSHPRCSDCGKIHTGPCGKDNTNDGME